MEFTSFTASRRSHSTRLNISGDNLPFACVCEREREGEREKYKREMRKRE